MTYKHIWLNALLSTVLLVSGAAMAQGNSDNAPGQNGNGKGNKNLGHGNASDGIMARIKADRQIYYTGEASEDGEDNSLDISVHFPRGAQLIQDGEVDAHLVIFEPNTALSAIDISSEASPENHKLFEMDSEELEQLPEGVYQLGVVLTVPEGDPLNMEDWYNGLLGLVTVQGLTVSSEPLSIDEDGDGHLDQDDDGDGIADVEQETTEEEEDGTTDTDGNDDSQ